MFTPSPQMCTLIHNKYHPNLVMCMCLLSTLTASPIGCALSLAVLMPPHLKHMFSPAHSLATCNLFLQMITPNLTNLTKLAHNLTMCMEIPVMCKLNLPMSMSPLAQCLLNLAMCIITSIMLQHNLAMDLHNLAISMGILVTCMVFPTMDPHNPAMYIYMSNLAMGMLTPAVCIHNLATVKAIPATYTRNIGTYIKTVVDMCPRKLVIYMYSPAHLPHGLLLRPSTHRKSSSHTWATDQANLQTIMGLLI